MQNYKVPVVDTTVGPNARGIKNAGKAVAGVATLIGIVGLAAWLMRKGRSAAGLEPGAGFSVEGDF